MPELVGSDREAPRAMRRLLITREFVLQYQEPIREAIRHAATHAAPVPEVPPQAKKGSKNKTSSATKTVRHSSSSGSQDQHIKPLSNAESLDSQSSHYHHVQSNTRHKTQKTSPHSQHIFRTRKSRKFIHPHQESPSFKSPIISSQLNLLLQFANSDKLIEADVMKLELSMLDKAANTLLLFRINFPDRNSQTSSVIANNHTYTTTN